MTERYYIGIAKCKDTRCGKTFPLSADRRGCYHCGSRNFMEAPWYGFPPVPEYYMINGKKTVPESDARLTAFRIWEETGQSDPDKNYLAAHEWLAMNGLTIMENGAFLRALDERYGDSLRPSMTLSILSRTRWAGREVPDKIMGKTLRDGSKIVPESHVQVHAYFNRPAGDDRFRNWLAAINFFATEGFEVVLETVFEGYSERRRKEDSEEVFFSKPDEPLEKGEERV